MVPSEGGSSTRRAGGSVRTVKTATAARTAAVTPKILLMSALTRAADVLQPSTRVQTFASDVDIRSNRSQSLTYAPASERNAAALSTRSHVNSGSTRPK